MPPPRPIRAELADLFASLSLAARGHGRTVPTGFADFDRHFGGLERGDLYVVGSRNEHDSTRFLLDLALSAVRSQHAHPQSSVLVFSLAQPCAALVQRLLIRESGVSRRRARRRELRAADWRRLTDAAHRLRSLPLWFDDVSPANVGHLGRQAWRVVSALRGRGEHLGLVLVSGTEFLISAMGGRRARRERRASRALKALAESLDAAVVVGWSVRRTWKHEGRGRLRVTDLRGGGQIAVAADATLFPSPPGRYRQLTALAVVPQP